MKTLFLTPNGITNIFFKSTLKTLFTVCFYLVGFCGFSQQGTYLNSLSVSAASETATYGTAGTISYSITVTRSDNGKGNALLSISGLPQGVTGTFSPPSVDFSGNDSTSMSILTLTTAATALAVTNSTFTVTAVTNNSVNKTGTFTINKFPLTITANNGTKCFDDTYAVGPGSTAFTSSGLKNNDTVGSITIASTGAASGAAAAAYPIVPVAAAGETFLVSNYAITYTNGILTVNPSNTVSLSSSAGTDAQTVCNNTAISTITYATTGATGATVSGLPTGVTGSWASNVVTISGTPSVSSGSPFNYTVTLADGCATIPTTGTITLNTPAAWTGTADTSWTNAGNWSCGVLPNNTSNVTINSGANQPVIASNLTINSLTIASGAILAVNSGFNLTVTNAIANAGTLIVKSNANLIQTNNVANTGVGITNVERNSSPLFRLDYTLWSSPVSGIQTLGGFAPLTSTNRFYEYNTTTDLYSAVSNGITFGLAKAYLIRMPNTWVGFAATPPTTPLPWAGTFAGTPNNGDITFGMSLAGTGYNAVGNPYPSTLNIDDFINANSITNNNIDGTLYFWRKRNDATNATSYSTCTTAGCTVNNGHTYPDGNFISVGQGFIVKATSTTLNFTNAMRVANNQNQFFKTKQIEKNRIWLNLSNNATPVSQTLVAYMEGASQGIDRVIDGRYINDSPTALNSLINNEEYTIQGRPAFDPSDIVPLAFKTNLAGAYTIAIDHVDGLFTGSQEVYLFDNTTGAEVNLKDGAYAFTAAAGVDNARFSLKYQRNLGVNVAAFNDNSVTVYKSKGTLYVNSGATAIANIKVFDIQGRLIVEQKNLKENKATIKDLKATQQVLIVKVTGQDNTVVSKKIVN